jgi:hypothetical protein
MSKLLLIFLLLNKVKARLKDVAINIDEDTNTISATLPKGFRKDISVSLNDHDQLPLGTFISNSREVELNIIGGELVSLGYLLAPLQGGWVCINNKGETYQITPELSCSCPANIAKPSDPCKHIKFLQWQQLYNSRLAQVLQAYQEQENN